ncbi:hypothetical protein JB92DRAFT_2896535, partial [Gautieria morchelliformis]
MHHVLPSSLLALSWTYARIPQPLTGYESEVPRNLSVDPGRLAERVRRSNSGSTVCATEVTSKRTEKNIHPHAG